MNEKENPDFIFDNIINTIDIFINENKEFPNIICQKLSKILNYINFIFDNNEDESNDGNLKVIEKLQNSVFSLKNQLEILQNKYELLTKENKKILNEEKELKPYHLLLNQKLKAKDDKFRLMEQKYLYYIDDQKKEINDLKKKLYQEELKNVETKDLNKINLFPGLMRIPEKQKQKSIKLIPMFKSSSSSLRKYKLKIKMNENESPKNTSRKDEKEEINLTTRTELNLNKLSVFDENKLLGNKKGIPLNNKNKNYLAFQTKMKEFNDIMMSYPDFANKHKRININDVNNNTII
jgi:hypothetical protein